MSQSVMVVSKLSAGVRSTLRPAGCVRLDERVIAVIQATSCVLSCAHRGSLLKHAFFAQEVLM